MQKFLTRTMNLGMDVEPLLRGASLGGGFFIGELCGDKIFKMGKIQ